MTLAASLDGAQVATLRDCTLALYTVEPFGAVDALALPIADGELAFVERQLFVRARDRLVLIATSPRLAIVHELEMPGTTAVRAASGSYVLLERDGALVVATCSSTAIAVAPLRAQVAARHAVALDQARFLIWSERLADMWSATSRQPLARLAIELPANVAAVGTTTQQRSVWIACASGELTTSRVSDGRTLAIELPGPPTEIVSHPMSAWLLADIGGMPHAINCALRSSMRVAVPQGPRTLVPAQADAFVIVDEGDRLVRLAFNSDSVPAFVPHAAPASRDPPAPPLVADESAPPPALRRPWGRQNRATLDDIATEPLADPEPPVEPPKPRSRPAPPAIVRAASRRAAASESGDWRDALWRWSRRVLAGACDEPLPPDGSPLATLCERADLPTAARRVLALVYAEWLAGKGDTGVAAVTLAEVAGPAGWAEALGTGRLAELGWVASDLGRCVLSREVGAALDGRVAGENRLFPRV